jgi:hypothetical protein
MSFLLKDPEAVLDYAIDWGAQYLGEGELLASSEWSVLPDEAGGVAVAGSDFDASVSSVKAVGGTAGRIYRLVNRIATDAGRVDERSIVLRVEDR